jgi:tetratricopeptide (TPR) repeat protein
MRLALSVLLAAFLPFAANAVGDEEPAPPQPTETTTQCAEGTIWNEETKTCVAPTEESLNDDMRYKAVRELSYADRPEEALKVLDAMQEGNTDRVLTYKGFASRKAGRIAEGMAFYDRALEQNPDNLLARSYMGQALAGMGKTEEASAQLVEISQRGGEGTWPYEALEKAIATGKGYSY